MCDTLTEHQLHQSFRAMCRIDMVHIIREAGRRIRKFALGPMHKNKEVQAKPRGRKQSTY